MLDCAALSWVIITEKNWADSTQFTYRVDCGSTVQRKASGQRDTGLTVTPHNEDGVAGFMLSWVGVHVTLSLPQYRTTRNGLIGIAVDTGVKTSPWSATRYLDLT